MMMQLGQCWLEQEDESDKEIGGEESDDEERAVNESDHSSDSEIDGDQLEDSDRSNHSESSDEDNENYYNCPQTLIVIACKCNTLY